MLDARIPYAREAFDAFVRPSPSPSHYASAAAAAQTLALPGTSGAWAWASGDVTAPCGSLTRVSLAATGPGAGQLLSLSCIALIENEP